MTTSAKALTRDALAARLALDIPEGWTVSLGIGIPTRVADVVPADREVVFQSEDGVIGFGPAPAIDGAMDLAAGARRLRTVTEARIIP